VALDVARAYADERQSRQAAEVAAERLARMQRVTVALSEAVTPADVANVLVGEGIAALGAEQSLVVVPAESPMWLDILGQRGLPPESLERYTRMPLETPLPVAETYRRGEPLWIETREQLLERFPSAGRTGANTPEAVVCLPLLSRGRVLGAIALGFATPRTFTPDERSFMQDLARQSAQVLERAQLYAAEQRARTALRDAHGTLEAIIQASPAAIALMDPDGTVRLWNPAAERIFGWTSDEVLGRLLPAVPDIRRDEFLSNLERVASGEAILGAETRRIRKGGAPIDVALWGSPVRHASGKVQCLYVITDITAQKRGQDAQRFLAQAGGLLSSSLDYEVTLERVAHLAVPAYAEGCYVYLLGEGGTVRCVATSHAGPAPVEMPRELGTLPLGVTAVSRVIAAGVPELRTHLASTSQQPAEPVDGPAMPCELAAQSYLCVPLLVRGQVIGALSFVSSARNYDAQDLALAQELARAAALAIDNARLYRESQNAIRLREEFLSIASHELKTPITALQLQVQSLLTGLVRSPEGPTPERLRRALETVDRQVNRQTQLVNDLLDVSRISAGRLELHPEAVHLSALCREVSERFEPELTRTGSLLSMELSPEAIGFWDRLRLDQVVTNLLSNAVKYGRGNPIHLATEVTGDRVRLTVKDGGIGIAPESVSRLFNRFERAVSERNYGGFGLGLWIARQIVEAMGGRIFVASELAVGSTFTVELPRARG
jgi:PAS domain S-box-containing protein